MVARGRRARREGGRGEGTAPPLADHSRARRAGLKRRLDHLYRTFDRGFLETDPLAFVHRYTTDADREIVGFIASTLAFGNVRAIQASVGGVLAALGPTPQAAVDRFDVRADGAALAGLYHRWIRGEDLAALMHVLRRMREDAGSIGGFFMKGYGERDADVGPGLASFSERARALAADVPITAGGARRAGTVARFFASPRDGSACKRLNLYLRWMVRDGDGLDLGVWRGISRRQLVLPLDTHLARLTRALGLARLKSPGWRMAVEATRSLALLDPEDPVKYDFSLSRLGILDRCLHGRDALDCRRCPPRIRVRRARRRALSQ